MRGERFRQLFRSHTQDVSIHAPRAGRKFTPPPISSFIVLFQSTPRVRGESKPVARVQYDEMSFNPRPACGAKAVFAPSTPDNGFVSIHAPRAGRKDCYHCVLDDDEEFQSTPRVRGERRWPPSSPCQQRVFQSTPRVRGERQDIRRNTSADFRFNPRPACGAKAITACWMTRTTSFNPRPACGAKAQRSDSVCSCFRFNPRPACGAKVPCRKSNGRRRLATDFREGKRMTSVGCVGSRSCQRNVAERLHLREPRRYRQFCVRFPYAGSVSSCSRLTQ